MRWAMRAGKASSMLFRPYPAVRLLPKKRMVFLFAAGAGVGVVLVVGAVAGGCFSGCLHEKASRRNSIDGGTNLGI